MDDLEGKQYNSLVEMTAGWKKGVEGQWSYFREEWTQELERLAKAIIYLLRLCRSFTPALTWRSTNAIGGVFLEIHY